MAIKIIKHGEKVFKAICPVCGCEFEYEYEDIIKNFLAQLKQVKCPDCGENIMHGEYKEDNPHIQPEYPDVKWLHTYIAPNDQYNCETCPNKPDPNNPVVGDTPCTWCKKNQFYYTNSTTTK